MIELPHPVGVCGRCGATTRSAASINNPCGRRIDGKRCAGSFGSAIGEKDWEGCPTCAKTGRVDGARCEQCEGDGWIFVRRNY